MDDKQKIKIQQERIKELTQQNEQLVAINMSLIQKIEQDKDTVDNANIAMSEYIEYKKELEDLRKQNREILDQFMHLRNVYKKMVDMRKDV